jgi:hypothetical protein
MRKMWHLGSCIFRNGISPYTYNYTKGFSVKKRLQTVHLIKISLIYHHISRLFIGLVAKTRAEAVMITMIFSLDILG